jgi:hypothetical protein
VAHEPAIRVRDLTKIYAVPVRGAGVAAAFKSLLHRETRQVEADQRIDFQVSQGEVVGFLGPNGGGAGRSAHGAKPDGCHRAGDGEAARITAPMEAGRQTLFCGVGRHAFTTVRC